MYDPYLGRFLSPDNYVQMPDATQSFNRYSYCLNNPLKYTDPSGEVFGVDDAILILAMAYIGGMQANFFNADNPFNPGDWNWSSGSTYTGIITGALSGAGMGGINILPQFNVYGAIPNGVLHAGINVGMNGLGNAINGEPFFEGWAVPAAMGFVSGAVMGHESAESDPTFNRNVCKGKITGPKNIVRPSLDLPELNTRLITDGMLAEPMDIGEIDISASSNGRPYYYVMKNNYPTYSSAQVYELIGGKVYENHLINPVRYSNSCALRLSRALNYSGAEIPYIKNQTGRGADGKYYFYKVADLKTYLTNTYGPPVPGSLTSMAKQKGIILFENCGWRNATGHIDLWNGSNCYYHCYWDRCGNASLWILP